MFSADVHSSTAGCWLAFYCRVFFSCLLLQGVLGGGLPSTAGCFGGGLPAVLPSTAGCFMPSTAVFIK